MATCWPLTKQVEFVYLDQPSEASPKGKGKALYLLCTFNQLICLYQLLNIGEHGNEEKQHRCNPRTADILCAST